MYSVLFRLPLLVLLLATPASAVVTIDWATVGGPGNACDVQLDGCFGSVAEPYRISKFEVTNAQYAEFLNAVAVTDTNALYSESMGLTFLLGGIFRIGSPGSLSYLTVDEFDDKPVNSLSFWNALRFANWLHNDQPTGAQDNTTTEDGAYTLTPAGIANNTVARNAGAEVFIPSEDEWYKAAYYDTDAMIYFDYPVGSDTQTTCTTPGATANTANCRPSPDLADVGSYSGSASPGGTFDQGGNVSEWNEAIILTSFRGLLGGSLNSDPLVLAGSWRDASGPSNEHVVVGFRVASLVPPPAVPSLSPLAITILSSLLGLAAWRRLRLVDQFHHGVEVD